MDAPSASLTTWLSTCLSAILPILSSYLSPRPARSVALSISVHTVSTIWILVAFEDVRVLTCLLAPFSIDDSWPPPPPLEPPDETLSLTYQETISMFG